MNEVYRTVGLYQPFASLMLFDKLETRWVREGRKPAFPEGEYLIYSTQKPCEASKIYEWSGPELLYNISRILLNEPTRQYNGFVIGKATLVGKWILRPEDENTYIKFIGRKTFEIEGKQVVKVQWALKFVNVQRVEPFPIKGKQGVGIYDGPKIKLLHESI